MAEFFQNVWSLLTTENENLIRFLSLFFVFIEITVATLLITTILKIKKVLTFQEFFDKIKDKDRLLSLSRL